MGSISCLRLASFRSSAFLALLLVLVGLVSGCAPSSSSSPSPTSTPAPAIKGIFHEYALPPSQFVPATITQRPDGNLWFTDFQYGVTGAEAGKIGGITTAGKLSDFPLPTTSYVPTSLTFGKDHTLWFIEVEVTASDPSGKNGKIGLLI